DGRGTAPHIALIVLNAIFLRLCWAQIFLEHGIYTALTPAGPAVPNALQGMFGKCSGAGVSPVYFRGQDARSSQAGCLRHNLFDTLSGINEGACALVRRLSIDVAGKEVNS